MTDEPLRRTPLHDSHVSLGARMVPFAGFEMPVQYATGIIAEHNWTRTSAGLFDVSHMGQCFVVADNFEAAAAAAEKLVPADIAGLVPGQQRYSQLLNESGGILDDVMLTRSAYRGYEGWLYVVVNASRKDHDFAWIASHLPEGVTLKRGGDMALLALQGPKSEDVLAKHVPAVRGLAFMHYVQADIGAMRLHVSRSGYTGEDGFEIALANNDAAWLWQMLLADAAVKPAGLGARDLLRLEAGLCLYGHDIDETTSPVEAGLVWSIGRRRRSEGRFIGSARVQSELAHGPSRKRVGIKPEGRAPAREGTVVTDPAGRRIGTVTSGGFGPTVNGPVAMGYVEAEFANPGTAVALVVRDKPIEARIVKLPFVPNNFKR